MAKNQPGEEFNSEAAKTLYKQTFWVRGLDPHDFHYPESADGMGFMMHKSNILVVLEFKNHRLNQGF